MNGLIGNEDRSSKVFEEERKKLSEPPIDILFNPSLVLKKDAWDIDISLLLRMLLDILERIQLKDLRICGVAALSSSMIHRIKVESIFRLHSAAEQKTRPSALVGETPVQDLKPIMIPFRHESTYPLSLQDLLSVLENMISDLAVSGGRKSRIGIEPVEDFSFEAYFVEIEELLAKYEAMVYSKIVDENIRLFSSLIADMDHLSSARCFLAVLYLGMKGRIRLEQTDDSNDVLLSIEHNFGALE